jgi:hypothetical protein
MRRRSLHFPLQAEITNCHDPRQVIDKFGERGRNRTFNLLIKSQLLCQLSYAPARFVGEFAPNEFSRCVAVWRLTAGKPPRNRYGNSVYQADARY